MAEIFFSERRNTLGAVIVTLHYPGAYTDQETIPFKFRKIFTEDVIRFYAIYQNDEPWVDRCFKIAQGHIAEEFRDDYIIDQFFLDALYRTASLDDERSLDCIAISLTDHRHSGLSDLWRNFKNRHRGSALIKFWSTRIPTAEEIAEAEAEEDNFISITMLPPKDRFDFAKLKIPQSKIGIPLDELHEELTFVDEAINVDPLQDVLTPGKRIEKTPSRWQKLDDFEDERSFLGSIAARRFSPFNFDELTKIYFSIYAYAPISYLFEGNKRSSREYYPVAPPDYALAGQLKITLYQNSGGLEKDKDWNTLVSAFRAIPTFDFGPGFETRIDWTRKFQQYGWAKYTRIYDTKGKFTDYYYGTRNYDRVYLDSHLGYIILKNGKPVLIIGFAISNNMRLLISQIQLVNPRGNRWLYKLPHGYFDYVLLKMQETFPDFDMYFVDGTSLANRIKASYGIESPMDLETFNHIVKTYSRPLELFERSEEMEWIGKYHYYKLT